MDNRRKKIVINKKFQYQYSLLIAAMAVLLVNGFIIVRMLFSGEEALALTTSMAIGLAAVELILLAGIWYASLVASHRIAGPVYVFAREITRLGEGDLTANIRLRDKDMFQPEAAQMNAGIAALSHRISTIKGLCVQLQQAQANGGDASSIVQQLTEHISTLTTTGE
jgi:methyl-accepting chemotaxis protein